MKLVKFIRFYSRGKPLTPKQIEREEERLRKVKEDFDEVWGDDLDYFDLLDNFTQTDDDFRKEK